MPDTVTRRDHFSVAVANAPGAAASVLTSLAAGGVNFTGFWGYSLGPDRGALELIPENAAAFRKAARKAKVAIGKKQTCLLIQGKDRPGAVGGHMATLGAAGINVHAAQGLCAGAGKYAAVIYVAPGDVRKAARALGA